MIGITYTILRVITHWNIPNWFWSHVIQWAKLRKKLRFMFRHPTFISNVFFPINFAVLFWYYSCERMFTKQVDKCYQAPAISSIKKVRPFEIYHTRHFSCIVFVSTNWMTFCGAKNGINSSKQGTWLEMCSLLNMWVKHKITLIKAKTNQTILFFVMFYHFSIQIFVAYLRLVSHIVSIKITIN